MRKSIYAITAVLLLLAAVGCDTTTGSGTEPGAGQGQDGLAVVSLSIAGTTAGRTVLPAQPEPKDVAAWRLLGGKTGETRKPLTALFSDPTNQTLHLATGDWDFTLEGPNTLSFVVEPVLDGTGSIEITIELPAGHGITRVEVFKDGTDLESPITPEGNNVVFKQEDHEAGDYYYSFRLYNKDDELYGVVSELVQVRLNLSSKAAPKLGPEDLNLSYVIEYHLDVNEPGPDYYRRTDAAPALAKPDERDGYEFDGWHTDEDLKDEPVTKLPTPVKGGNRDFYAQWEIINYPIFYKPDDQGINYGANPPTYTIEDGDIALEKPPKRPGFRFGGWYRDAELQYPITKTPEIPAGSTGDRTFYAEWIDQYTIIFETHGGSEVADITEDMGTPVPWPENPEWGESRFNGWFDETGDIEYKGSYTPAGNVTMHAQWKHPVTFYPNGGSPPPETQYVVEGKKAEDPGAMIGTVAGLYMGPIDVNSLTVDFDSWHNDPDCIENLWDFGSNTVDEPLDLYAKWTVSPSPIDISGQSGDTVIEKALAYIAGQSLGEETPYTIVLDRDVSMAGVSSPNITTANAVITLAGKGPEPTEISLSSNGALFWIGAGKLVLGNNITLKGRDSNNSSLVRVNAGASLTMNVGATITDNKGVLSGGGVFIYGGGTFDMEGGKISNNTIGGDAYCDGGGVFGGGTFNMKGGEISGNSANGDGGGVYVSGSTFNMSGGTISGNSTPHNGGGVYVYSGSFSKTGPSIIYGDTNRIHTADSAENTTTQADSGNGHAVYYAPSYKYRDSTLNSEENISTSNTGTGSGWGQ